MIPVRWNESLCLLEPQFAIRVVARRRVWDSQLKLESRDILGIVEKGGRQAFLGCLG